MLGGADNPNGELLSYIIGADSCNKSTRCEHSSSTVALARGWQMLVWLSSNRHRIVAPPCCSRNQRNTTGEDGQAV